jgi:dephospho-CoA kinase
MSRLLRVGLTGGIATGKSYVRALFTERGVPTLDADTVAREVVEPGSPVLAAIVARFGEDVLQPDGHLDRRKLGQVVFADDAARHDLERIVHPAVYSAIRRWLDVLEASSRHTLAVVDIPLLFETGRERDFDVVIVTACSPDTQVRRVMARDRASADEARRRLAAQWPIDEKAARADHVIRTDGSFEETEREFEQVCQRVLARSRSG